MTLHDLVTRARRARRRDQLHVVVRNVLRADLFVLDEFLPLEAADATFLFEVVNKRSKPPIRLSSPATRASGSGGRSSRTQHPWRVLSATAPSTRPDWSIRRDRSPASVRSVNFSPAFLSILPL